MSNYVKCGECKYFKYVFLFGSDGIELTSCNNEANLTHYKHVLVIDHSCELGKREEDNNA